MLNSSIMSDLTISTHANIHVLLYSHIDTCSVTARPLLKTTAAIVSGESLVAMQVNRGATLQTLERSGKSAISRCAKCPMNPVINIMFYILSQT